jgi:hypothetical protein
MCSDLFIPVILLLSLSLSLSLSLEADVSYINKMRAPARERHKNKFHTQQIFKSVFRHNVKSDSFTRNKICNIINYKSNLYANL